MKLLRLNLRANHLAAPASSARPQQFSLPLADSTRCEVTAGRSSGDRLNLLILRIVDTLGKHLSTEVSSRHKNGDRCRCERVYREDA